MSYHIILFPSLSVYLSTYLLTSQSFFFEFIYMKGKDFEKKTKKQRKRVRVQYPPYLSAF